MSSQRDTSRSASKRHNTYRTPLSTLQRCSKARSLFLKYRTRAANDSLRSDWRDTLNRGQAHPLHICMERSSPHRLHRWKR